MTRLYVDRVHPPMEETEIPPRYFDTGKGRTAWWRFCEEGCEDAVPVVMVHGGPGDGCDPAKGSRMALKRPIYQYDQLGCGKSDSVDLEGYGEEDFASELAGLLEHFGHERYILIGASWGAGVICAYLKRYGMSKVAALVMPSPFLSSQIWYDDQVTNMKSVSETMYLRMMDFVHGRAPESTYSEIMAEYYARFLFTRECNKSIAQAVAASEPNPVFKALWGPNDMVCTGSLADFDVSDILPEITVPVLYMCGDSDEVTLPTMESYVESTPGSRLAVIPFAGHALAFEQFDLYRECIEVFLSEIGL